MLNGNGFLIGPNFAEKLRETVRRVDGSPVNGPVSRLETRFEDVPAPPTNVRIGDYDGSAWSKNGTKTVTLRNVGVTGYTVSVVNVLSSLPATAEATSACIIARDGTAWYLVQPQPSGGGKAGTFSGAWGFGSDKVVTPINGGGTFNCTNLIYTIPDYGETLNCISVQDGTAWYLANVQHRSTTVLTRVAIEGSNLVFDRAGIQVIGDTSTPTTFPLSTCDTYSGSTVTNSTASSGAGSGSYASTSFFLG